MSKRIASRDRNDQDESAADRRRRIDAILTRPPNTVLPTGALSFLAETPEIRESTDAGPKGRLQAFLKRNGSLYYKLLAVLGPVWCDGRHRRKVRETLARRGTDAVVVNIGSGPVRFAGRADILNVDLFPFAEVDLLADAANLPIRDESVDLALNVAVLEHVPDPEPMVAEMRRILRPGGEILCFVPFMQPFHAAPHDYRRWAWSGVERLFADFRDVEIWVAPGPTSGALWVFQEWTATMVSFGNRTLHDLALLALMLATFPVKFLDEFASRLPAAKNCASGFFVRGRK